MIRDPMSAELEPPQDLLYAANVAFPSLRKEWERMRARALDLAPNAPLIQ